MLLDQRICDLGLQLNSSDIYPRIQRLYEELSQRGIIYHPLCYLTREWLCPDREPAIGIPFPLTHPRLRSLERNMMLEVEGGKEKEFMQLIRHETGHALNYAFRLYRRSRWRELFGPISLPYNPHSYAVRPYSRQYVLHLPGNYAQAHPDEDFAETFAVWLTPGLDWRKKYRDWGALKKLEYVDHLMRNLDFSKPIIPEGQRHWQARKLRSTLRSYYAWKRREFAEGYPGYYDPDLLKIFREDPGHELEKASDFLRNRHKYLTQTVAKWTHAPKYTVDSLIRRLIHRTREWPLYRHRSESESLVDLTAWLTTQVLEGGSKS